MRASISLFSAPLIWVICVSLSLSVKSQTRAPLGPLLTSEASGSYVLFPQLYNPGAMNASEWRVSLSGLSNFDAYGKGQVALELPSYFSRISFGLGMNKTTEQINEPLGQFQDKEQYYLNMTLPFKINDGVLSIGLRPYFARYQEAPGSVYYGRYAYIAAQDFRYEPIAFQDEVNTDIGIYWKARRWFVSSALTRLVDNELSKSLYQDDAKKYLQQRNLYLSAGFMLPAVEDILELGGSFMSVNRGSFWEMQLQFNQVLFRRIQLGFGAGVAESSYFFSADYTSWFTAYLGYRGNRLDALAQYDLDASDTDPASNRYRGDQLTLQVNYRLLKTGSKKAITQYQQD